MSGRRQETEEGQALVAQWVCTICAYTTTDADFFQRHYSNHHKLATTADSLGLSQVLQLLRERNISFNHYVDCIPHAMFQHSQPPISRSYQRRGEGNSWARFRRNKEAVQDGGVLVASQGEIEPTEGDAKPLLRQLENPLPKAADLVDGNPQELDLNLHL